MVKSMILLTSLVSLQILHQWSQEGAERCYLYWLSSAIKRWIVLEAIWHYCRYAWAMWLLTKILTVSVKLARHLFICVQLWLALNCPSVNTLDVCDHARFLLLNHGKVWLIRGVRDVWSAPWWCVVRVELMALLRNLVVHALSWVMNCLRYILLVIRFLSLMEKPLLISVWIEAAFPHSLALRRSLYGVWIRTRSKISVGCVSTYANMKATMFHKTLMNSSILLIRLADNDVVALLILSVHRLTLRRN